MHNGWLSLVPVIIIITMSFCWYSLIILNGIKFEKAFNQTGPGGHESIDRCPPHLLNMEDSLDMIDISSKQAHPHPVGIQPHIQSEYQNVELLFNFSTQLLLTQAKVCVLSGHHLLPRLQHVNEQMNNTWHCG